MMPKTLGLALAGLVLSAAGPVVAQNATTNTSPYGSSRQSVQNQLTPVPTQAPPLTQPSAAQNSAQPVTKMANAEQKLTAAKVQDMLGRPLGNVQSIHTSAGGTVTSVQVALNTQTEAGKTVNIPASQLTYDVHSGVVIAQLTQTEVDAMPATSPTAKPPRGY